MKKNKILSLILALAMAFSLAVPALASGTNINYTGEEETTVEIESKLNEQVIKVTLASKPGAVLNPYGLGYTARTNYKVYDQVASLDNLIVSTSNVPLTVAVAASGDAGEIELLDSWDGSAEGREVYMYAVFKALDTSEITDTAKDVTVSAALADTNKIYPKDKVTGLQMPIDYPSGDDLITEVTDNVPMANAIIIQAPSGSGSSSAEDPLPVAMLAANNTTDGTAANTKTLSAVAYKLCGNMVEEPDDGPWTSDDAVTVNLEFTFNPARADTRLQKIWAYDSLKGFDIDLQKAYEQNPDNTIVNVSVPDFEVYGLSAYETDYAYALALRLPDKAKLTEEPTVGTSNMSEDIESRTAANAAFAAISSNKKATVARYTQVDSVPDGFVTIKLTELRDAVLAATTPESVKVPVKIAFKMPDATQDDGWATTATTYTVNVIAKIKPFAAAALNDGVAYVVMTRAATTDAAVVAAGNMATALGINDPTKLTDVNLIGVTGDITSIADVTVGADGAVTIAANKCTTGRDTYVTLELSYKDDGTAKTAFVNLHCALPS